MFSHAFCSIYVLFHNSLTYQDLFVILHKSTLLVSLLVTLALMHCGQAASCLGVSVKCTTGGRYALHGLCA